MSIKYSLDDLPKFSDWPSKITGNSTAPQFHKSRKEVLREFDKEKWSILLKNVKSANKRPGLKLVETLYMDKRNALVFINGKFELLSLIKAQEIYRALVAKELRRICKNYPIVELGSGYGSMVIGLALMKKFRGNKFFASEISKNGRELIKLISANENLNIDVLPCDLTRNKIIEGVPENSVLFTSYSVHYQPILKHQFIDSITKLKPKYVVNFEPIYEHCDTTSLHGQLSKRYIELNDYNRNFATILKQSEAKNKIQILSIKPSVFGSNALLPISVIVWQPK